MVNTPLVLLVGGDAPTRAMVRYLLEDDGAAVVELAEPAALGSAPHPATIALLVLIADAPDHDISPLLAALRWRGCQAPTLVLTPVMSPPVRQRAGALGVVEVIGVPLDPRVLQTLLHRALVGAADPARGGPAPPAVCAGGLTLRTATREVSAEAPWTARLTRRETSVLQALMAAPGHPLRRQELWERVWGQGYGGTSNVLDATVTRLCQKLLHAGARQRYVRNVRGWGYVFDARAMARPAQDTETGGTPRVLLVEDAPPTVALIRTTLEQDGYAVHHGQGEEALALARRLRPAVILLAIAMANSTGVELRRQLSADPHTAAIPVIALAASRILRLRAHEIQAHDYLATPVDADELLLRIAKWAGPRPGHPG